MPSAAHTDRWAMLPGTRVSLNMARPALGNANTAVSNADAMVCGSGAVMNNAVMVSTTTM